MKRAPQSPMRDISHRVICTGKGQERITDYNGGLGNERLTPWRKFQRALKQQIGEQSLELTSNYSWKKPVLGLLEKWVSWPRCQVPVRWEIMGNLSASPSGRRSLGSSLLPTITAKQPEMLAGRCLMLPGTSAPPRSLKRRVLLKYKLLSSTVLPSPHTIYTNRQKE